jgi:hypothetical protein
MKILWQLTTLVLFFFIILSATRSSSLCMFKLNSMISAESQFLIDRTAVTITIG